MTKFRGCYLQKLHSSLSVTTSDILSELHIYHSVHAITHLICAERYTDAADLLKELWLAETILENLGGSAISNLTYQIIALENNASNMHRSDEILIQSWRQFCRSLLSLIPPTLNPLRARHRLLQLGLDLPETSPLRQISERAWVDRGSTYPMYTISWESSITNTSPALIQRFMSSIEYLMACDISQHGEFGIVGGGNFWWTPNGYLPPGDCSIKVIHLKTGDTIQNMTGHQAPIIGVAYAFNDAICISASLDKSLRWWEVKTGIALDVYTMNDSVVRCVTTLNDKAFAGFENGTLLAWTLHEQPLRYAKFNHPIVALTSHHDSDSLWIIVKKEGVYRIKQNGDAELIIPCPNACALSVNDAGEIVAVGTDTGDVILFHQQEIWRASVSPDAVGCLYIDEKFVWVGCRAGISLGIRSAINRKIIGFTLTDGHPLLELNGHNTEVVGLAGTKCHNLLVSISHDSTIIVWKPSLAEAVDKTSDNMEYINSLIANDDYIATVSDDGSIRVWKTKESNAIWKDHIHSPQPAIWVFERPHVKELVSVDSAGNAWRWTISGQLLALYPLIDTNTEIECTGATLNHDGSCLLRFIDGPSDEDCFVIIDNLETLETHRKPIIGAIKSIQKFIAPVEDENFIVLSHRAEACAILDISTGECRAPVSVLPSNVSQLNRGLETNDYFIGTEDGLVFHWRLHADVSLWTKVDSFIKAITPCPSSNLSPESIMVSDTSGIITWFSSNGEYETSWAHSSWSSALAICQNGEIALACSDGILRTLRLREHMIHHFNLSS